MRPLPLCLLILPLLLTRVLSAAPGASQPRESAATELRLPADRVYSRVVGSDRAVVFSHQTHVAFAGKRCTGCHPLPYPMLRRGPRPSHQAMDAGGSCGMCHDGRKAFAMQDSSACRACHSGTRAPQLSAAGKPGTSPSASAARPVPKPHTYPRGGDSPGTVTFRHETHLRGTGGCKACHPRPFPMASAPPRPNGGMHEPASCGACHDGTKAFAAEDPASCARCHVETGARP